MFANRSALLLAERTGIDNFVQYNISPFQRKHVAELMGFATGSTDVPAYIAQNFGAMRCHITDSGRSAIELALCDLRLSGEDEVWIETTSNNFYVSGCVTRAIEKYCKWSRSFSEKTKAILVNHEFGFPSERMAEYREYGLPLIEDCAFSFLSQNSCGGVGRDADYIIASFPKFLPVPFGGALYSKNPVSTPDFFGRAELMGFLQHCSGDLLMLARKRKENYRAFESLFGEFGIFPRFKMEEFHVPGVFMFRTGMKSSALQALKLRLNSEGIQSSVFYGEDAYFVPCHQELSDTDIQVIVYKTVRAMGMTI